MSFAHPKRFRVYRSTSLALLLGVAFAGCGDDETTTPASNETGNVNANSPQQNPADIPPASNQPARRPLQLNNITGNNTANEKIELAGVQRTEAIRKALDPLQIMVGSWRGESRGTTGGFGSLEESAWRWDYSNRQQPALLVESETSPFLREAKMTYWPNKEVFTLTGQDGEGIARNFEGIFTETPRDVPGDNDTLQRTFKIRFREVQPADPRDAWQIVFNQRHNNRFLMELRKQSPSSGEFNRRFETVGNQRQGTSFAGSPDDYGERTCIISQGLGTSTVSYNGETYWVCCSGCKAAFEDDPEFWLAKAADRTKQN